MGEDAGRGWFEPLADFQPAELPAQTLPFWKLTGPGAVLVGLSIGAGEIVVWPRIAAEYGASMVWAAVVGIFLQLWINLEVGRWTVATGESVYTGFARTWRWFAPLFILFNILGWLAPGWARTSGLALKALVVGPYGFGSDTFWTAVTFAGVALLLFGPKLVYQSVERTIGLLILIVVVGLVVVAGAVGTADHWLELGRGMVNFGFREPGFGVKPFFIALVFAGAGGTANLFYTFYLRDKQIGMGAHVPRLENRARGRQEAQPAAGFRYDDNPENAGRIRGWLKYVSLDQSLYFFVLNAFTILLFIFGALCVLHSANPPRIPAAGTLIWDEAQVLGQVWGGTGRTLFLLVGFATLFSTQLALVDGVSRSVADIVYTNFRGARVRSMSWWYQMVAAGWILAGIAITFVLERQGISELGFLFNAAYMGGFAMAVYVPLLLVINHRYLPRSARPGPLHTFMMIVCSLVYGGFAVACLLWQFGH